MKKIFDGTLGKYTGSNYNIELKDFAEPFPVPKIHKPTLKKIVNRLIKLQILKKIHYSQWAAPTFTTPKKNDTERFKKKNKTFSNP